MRSLAERNCSSLTNQPLLRASDFRLQMCSACRSGSVWFQPRLAERMERQVAVMLIQKGQEPLVVAGHHVEQIDQFPVAALRLFEAAPDDFTDVSFRQLA